MYEAHHIRTELAHAVAAQYFAWQMATEQLALLDTRIELADKALKLMQQRVKSAAGSCRCLARSGNGATAITA